MGKRRDLKDQPWPECPNWYTDSSSFVVEGKGVAGAAVVERTNIIWASHLPEGLQHKKLN